jgi:hypothetical protein
LLDPFDLHLGLLDMHLDALAQGRRARHLEGFLHASQSLFFGAVCILELFTQEFADFGFHFYLPLDAAGGYRALRDQIATLNGH